MRAILGILLLCKTPSRRPGLPVLGLCLFPGFKLGMQRWKAKTVLPALLSLVVGDDLEASALESTRESGRGVVLTQRGVALIERGVALGPSLALAERGKDGAEWH